MGDDLVKPENVPNIPIIDISNLNLLQLGSALENSLKKHRSNWLFIKRIQNEKTLLDEENLRALIAQIQDLRDMNSALLELNADIYLTQERMERIIERYREQENFVDAQGRRLAEISLKRCDDELQLIDDGAAERALKLQLLNMDIKLKEAQLSQLNSQTGQINTSTKEIDARAEFIKKALESINISELPPALQTYITSSIFNPSGTQFNDFDMQQQIKEFIIRKEKAEAVEKESQADVARKTADKTISDIEQLKKTR
jgi:hypothetical protein